MGQQRETEVEGIKRRLLEGLDGRPQRWLATQTGDDYKNVQRWVSGDVVPPVDFIPRYCEVLGLSVDWVLTGKLPKAKLDPNVRDLALDLIRGFLDAKDLQQAADEWTMMLRAKGSEPPADGNNQPQ